MDKKEATRYQDEHGAYGSGALREERNDETTIIEDWTNAED